MSKHTPAKTNRPRLSMYVELPPTRGKRKMYLSYIISLFFFGIYVKKAIQIKNFEKRPDFLRPVY